MPSISLFHTPPSETIKSQVQQLVIDDLSELSQVAIVPSNPLYQLYQYGIGYEVHLYFDAMDGTRNMPVELIVALDEQDQERVLGFILYQPTLDDPQACSVAYLAVRPAQRRQGLARAMLNTLLARYPHVELACSVGKVPYFEAMGMQVLAARGPQVLMNTRGYRSAGLLPVLDVAPIYRSLEVRQIHAYLLQQHGKRAMSEAEKKRDRHLDQLGHHARLLVQQRLGQ